VVPVLVLTGFLGSGKTTLLNRVLARRAARPATAQPEPPYDDAAGAAGARAVPSGRIALIVNELGEVGVDGDLLAGDARQVELPGGCVCCVLGDALDRTVLDLIATNPGLDAIVLETTGVAEPLPIAWAFERAPLAGAARLAAIVTLVDLSRFVASRPIAPAVDEQVRHADVLILTKRDLVDPAGYAAAREAVRALAPAAPIVEGTPDDAAAWLEGAIAEVDLRERGREPDHDHDHDHDHDRLGNAAHGIDTVWLPIPRVVDLEELEERLALLPASYIRIKGIARAVDGRTGDDTPRWVAFHRVGLRVSSEPIAGPAEPRVVALGPGVERGPLAACIEAAVLSSLDGHEG
jgi:G3E family GTPase